VQPGEEKAQKDLLHMYNYLLGGSKGEWARHFSVVSSDRTRGNVQKPETQEIPFKHKKIPNFFY